MPGPGEYGGYKQPGGMPAVSVVTTVWGSVQAQPVITQTQGTAVYPTANQYMQPGIKRRPPGPGFYPGMFHFLLGPHFFLSRFYVSSSN